MLDSEPSITDLIVRPASDAPLDADRIWHAAESGRTCLLEGLRVASTMLWRIAQDVENPIDPDDLASFAWLMSYVVELVGALESCRAGFESELSE